MHTFMNGPWTVHLFPSREPMVCRVLRAEDSENFQLVSQLASFHESTQCVICSESQRQSTVMLFRDTTVWCMQAEKVQKGCQKQYFSFTIWKVCAKTMQHVDDNAAAQSVGHSSRVPNISFPLHRTGKREFCNSKTAPAALAGKRGSWCYSTAQLYNENETSCHSCMIFVCRVWSAVRTKGNRRLCLLIYCGTST